MCDKWYKIIFLLIAITSQGKTQMRNSDISIYFYSKSNPVLGNTIDISNPSDLAKVGFSKDKDTVFLIHGYLEMPASQMSSSQELKNVILSKHDANIVVVDYGKLSAIFYPVAVQQVEDVGRGLALMIKNMVKKSGLNLKKTKIFGVSLGAHVAGVAGTALGGEVDQIVALDPAGPLFNLQKTSNRLSKSSAKFVHVIHTNGGRFGMLEPIGHADYYPNGGRTQPACGPNDLPIPTVPCSHVLSLTYYSESIQNGNFEATKCSDYERFTAGKCNDGEKSLMGEYNVDKKASGIYFLETNLTPPYAKG